MNVMIQTRDVQKSFGPVQALHGVSMEVNRGEVVCLIGPSGSGKSTFLRCINHLEVPDKGDIRVDGRPIGYVETIGRRRPMRGKELAELRAGIGMVFQLFYLWPHLSVIENVTLGLTEVRGIAMSAAVDQGHRMLAKVG